MTGPADMRKRLLQICWPGADWKSLLPMLDDGLLPNLRRLIDRGVIGKLTSVQPAQAAPVWASVATGMYPHHHGVLSNLEPVEEARGVTFRRTTRLSCYCEPVWGRLQRSAVNSVVIGWPATFPVDNSLTAVVTPEFWAESAVPKNSWFVRGANGCREELAAELANLRVPPNDITGLDLVALVPKLAELQFAIHPMLETLAAHVAESSTTQCIATWLLQNTDWDFATVFFNGFWEISNNFVNFQGPKLPFVTDADFELFQNVVRGNYVLHDLMLGRLIELAGDEVGVLVVSDSGIHAGKKRNDEPNDASSEFIEPGLMVLAGPGIVEDELMFGSSVLDLAPTILGYFCVPINSEFDGRILQSVFDPPRRVEVGPVISQAEEATGQGSFLRHENRPVNYLIDLNVRYASQGEIDFSTPNSSEVLTRDLLYYASESLIAAKREGQAIPILRLLSKLDPTESKFLYKLMTCYVAIGEHESAQATFRQFYAQKRRFAPIAAQAWKKLDGLARPLTAEELAWKSRLWKQSRINLDGMAFLSAWILYARADYEEAFRVANQADETKVFNPPALLRLRAESLCKLGRQDEAVIVYNQMLALNEEDFDAEIGLASIAYRSNRFGEAVNHAANAIFKRYFNPVAHYIYGAAIYQCGKPKEAIDALKVAVSQDPKLVGAFQRLTVLHRGPVPDPVAAKEFRQQLAQAISAERRYRELRKAGYDAAIRETVNRH